MFLPRTRFLTDHNMFRTCNGFRLQFSRCHSTVRTSRKNNFTNFSEYVTTCCIGAESWR